MKLYFKNHLINKFLSKENQRLVRNFTSLAFIQATNFVLPLLVIPHQIRVLGIEKFGLVSFAQVLSLYFVIFSEYGFNLSATKEVSLHCNNKSKLKEIYNSVITTRLFLCIVGFTVLALLVFAIPSLRKDYPLYFFSSTMFFGQALVPIWFFLGTEKMKYITFLNFVSKVLFTLLTFIVITKPEDYIYANMLHGLGSVIAGVISMYIVAVKFGIRYKISSPKAVKSQLKSSFSIFISNFATNIYMNINLVILNFVASAEIVGMYSVAEKVFIAAKHIISVVFQTIYPYACKLKEESEHRFKQFFTRFTYLLAVMFFTLGSFTFYFAEDIIFILSGKEIEYATNILKLLSFVPFIIGINIPAYQTNLIYDYKKSFSFVMITASIINVGLNLLLGSKFQAYGTVAAITITEVYVMIALNSVIFTKAGLSFFKPKDLLSSLTTS